MGVIFDLDQTIADTSSALALRNRRQWSSVIPLVRKFVLYPGIKDLIDELNDLEIPICIVTNSPANYCNAVLSHHKIPIIHKVCWHDTGNHKPHPEPILKALEYLNVKPGKVFSVGDDPKDIAASNAAGVISVAATWGCTDKKSLLSSKPKFVCNNVAELRTIILKK